MAEAIQTKTSLKRKPNPKDPIEPMKTNFIKAKYENLTFIARGKYSSIEELNQQLMAAVKTHNYEISLRLFSQGADANYKNYDEGFSCVHVAVLNNQIGQVELLNIFGADLTVLDRNGNSAYDLAKMNGFNAIADRLQEIQFELTDEFAYFLCSKRTDHKSAPHIHIPDLNESQEAIDALPSMFKKLQELPDHQFEELCRDLYDEVDRRQLETIWKNTVGQHLLNAPIPFLVIKSCFSQTRNQLRQKLARFTSLEFSYFLIEILNETKNRYGHLFTTHKKPAIPRKIKQPKEKKTFDDDPLYDKVPSDEDYASVASEPASLSRDVTINQFDDKSASSSNQATPSKKYVLKELNTNFDKPFKINSNANAALSPNKLFQHAESTLNSMLNNLNQTDLSKLADNGVKSSFKKKFSGVTDQKNFNDVLSENEMMQQLISNLMEENAQLRSEKMLTSATYASPNFMQKSTIDDQSELYSTVNKKSSSLKQLNPQQSNSSKASTPVRNVDNLNVLKIELKEEENLRIEMAVNENRNNLTDIGVHKQMKSKSNENLNQKVAERLRAEFMNYSNSASNSPTHAPYSQVKNLNSHPQPQQNTRALLKENVIRKMKKITKAIKDLYTSSNDAKFETLNFLCEKVNDAVNEMVELFEQPIEIPEVQECLQLLIETNRNLFELTQKSHKSSGNIFANTPTSSAFLQGDSASNDILLRNVVVNNMISYSYDIAYTVKKLVTLLGADGAISK